MDCPACGAETVAFRVPDDLREFAPEGGATAAICADCLSVAAAPDGDPDGDFAAIIDAFPEGEAGAATALAVGLLVESLALNRDAIATLLDHAVAGGADPWLVLERLGAAPGIDPADDLDRARRQLDGLLG